MSVPPPPPPLQNKYTRPPPKQVSESSGPAFLADIKAGKALRKVPDSEKKDRSAPLTSRTTDRNDAGSTSGLVSTSNGGCAPTGLPNPFANGAPKLKPVGSLDTSRNPAPNPFTKQSAYGYAKNPAPPPPPPLSAPPLSPPQTPSVFQNVIPSDVPSTTPCAVYHRPNLVSNGITAIRNGPPPPPPPPPTPARPSISRSDSNYHRYDSYRKSSVEVSQPSKNIMPSSVQAVTHSSIPISPTTASAIMNDYNNNTKNHSVSVNSSNTNGDNAATPPPSSGRSPRRKQSSSNRYQRVGSTNTDVNGIPIGQSTKLIRISSGLNGSSNEQAPSPAPSLPSSVYDLSVVNSRAHPTPPPPPPPPPTAAPPSMSEFMNNNTNNSIASLIRHFESRFNFPDIGNVPVPKPYHGPKTYRSHTSGNINDGLRTQVPHRVAPSAPRNY
ncbi:unnamed protein product [Heterobilharzia americana]|nr:unnamed protein product [Heterobilharzia americana]